MPVSWQPKRVWVGVTVPGKKMVRLLIDAGILDSPRQIVDLYEKEPASVVVHSVAIALRQIPTSGGAFGPSPQHMALDSPGSLYTAAIADVRDFLKLRFRVSEGPGDDEVAKTVCDAVGELHTIVQHPLSGDQLSTRLYNLADQLVGASTLLEAAESPT